MTLVSNNINLSPTRTDDAPAIVQHMRDKEIYDHTLVIPYPYTLENARTWLEDNDIFAEENGVVKNLAIRSTTGEIIGAIGLHYNYGVEASKSEFGYWLAKPYWNQGIMTAVIKKFCEIAKADGLNTLEAHTFAFNIASQKVLLKAGFTERETLPGFYKKDGGRIDAVKFEKHL